MKKCNKCLIEKPFDKMTFRRNKNNEKVFKPLCKRCHVNRVNEYAKEKRRLNPSKRGPKIIYKLTGNKKKCTSCNEIKDYCFYPLKRKNSNEMRSICRECKNKKDYDLRKKNISYKIKSSIKSHLSKYKNVKNVKSNKYIGCSYNLLKEWLEYRFDDKMSWDNYGKYWHIDHIIPSSSFNYENKYEIYLCNNWKNLQPLESKENIFKSDKITAYYIFNNIIHLNRFITKKSLNKEYQGIKETLYWLRENLRYGKKLSDDSSTKILKKILDEMDNSHQISLNSQCKNKGKCSTTIS